MEKPPTGESPPMLPGIAAIIFALVLVDIFQLWLPEYAAKALGYFLGMLSLGLSRKLNLSRRRLILGALVVAAGVTAVAALWDLLLSWIKYARE